MTDPNQLISLLEKIRAQSTAVETASEARALWLVIYKLAYEEGKSPAECKEAAQCAVIDFEEWTMRYNAASAPVDIDELLRSIKGA